MPYGIRKSCRTWNTRSPCAADDSAGTTHLEFVMSIGYALTRRRCYPAAQFPDNVVRGLPVGVDDRTNHAAKLPRIRQRVTDLLRCPTALPQSYRPFNVGTVEQCPADRMLEFRRQRRIELGGSHRTEKYDRNAGTQYQADVLQPQFVVRGPYFGCVLTGNRKSENRSVVV